MKLTLKTLLGVAAIGLATQAAAQGCLPRCTRASTW